MHVDHQVLKGDTLYICNNPNKQTNKTNSDCFRVKGQRQHSACFCATILSVSLHYTSESVWPIGNKMHCIILQCSTVTYSNISLTSFQAIYIVSPHSTSLKILETSQCNSRHAVKPHMLVYKHSYLAMNYTSVQLYTKMRYSQSLQRSIYFQGSSSSDPVSVTQNESNNFLQ